MLSFIKRLLTILLSTGSLFLYKSFLIALNISSKRAIMTRGGDISVSRTPTMAPPVPLKMLDALAAFFPHSVIS